MTINNVLLVVDTRNLFNTLHKHYGNGKLDYQRYVELAGSTDHLFDSIAYGQQSENSSVNFITMLSKLGFVCKFKQLIKFGSKVYYNSSNVQLAIDVTDRINSGKIDRVVIGSSDPDLVDLVHWVRSTKGLRCDIIACKVPKILRDIASNVVDIDAALLLSPVGKE